MTNFKKNIPIGKAAVGDNPAEGHVFVEFDKNGYMTVRLSDGSIVNPDTTMVNFGASRQSSSVNSSWLRHYNGTPYNLVQFQVPFDGKIVAMTAQCQSAVNHWRAEVRDGNSASVLSQLLVDIAETEKIDDTLSVAVNKGDLLGIYMTKNPAGAGAGTNIPYPKVEVIIQRT